MVYYICPVNDQTPIGGVLVLYRHVDVLNRAGVPAKIVHGVAGFRCRWFENETPIAYPPFEVTDEDLLVVPEVVNPLLGRIAPRVPRVSLNQNAYLTFSGLPLEVNHSYRTSSDLLGVICISEDSRRYLEYAFPGIDVQRVFNSYGDQEFFPPEQPKSKQIAYMPRKRAGDAHQVLSILRQRGALAGWEIVAIDGLHHLDVAATLRRSALFLSTIEHEGCALPPIEALACGCYVIGYTGFGGAEYFDPRFTTVVPESDILTFARTVERWLAAWDAVGSLPRSRAASDFIRRRYSHEAERASLVSAYEHLLAKRPAPRGVRHMLRADETWTVRPRSDRYLAARQIKHGFKDFIRAGRRTGSR
jgi:Glycosyl transferases group 1